MESYSCTILVPRILAVFVLRWLELLKSEGFVHSHDSENLF